MMIQPLHACEQILNMNRYACNISYTAPDMRGYFPMFNWHAKWKSIQLIVASKQYNITLPQSSGCAKQYCDWPTGSQTKLVDQR